MKMQRILSLDGGGIRGLVSCRWLEAVERALVAAGKPALPGHFDLLAGSSTGAIVACGLAAGHPPAQLAEFYLGRRHEIFPGMAGRLWSRAGRTPVQGISAPRYDPAGIEHVLQSVFGDLRLGELRTPTVLTSYCTVERKPVIFKSFNPAHQDVRVWEACRASTAAPTYFPAFGLQVEGRMRSLIDGGVVANNPTACAIAEALRKDENVECTRDLLVLSVGTGQRNRPIPLADAREWGALEWAVPIIDVLFDGNTESVDYIAQQLVGDGYFRMQADLVVGLDDLDDTSETNVRGLEALAADYLLKADTVALLRRLAQAL